MNSNMELAQRESYYFSLMGMPERLDEALSSTLVTTVAEKRQLAHWQAKSLMLQSNYHGAIAKLLNTSQQLGEHFGMSLDLVVCYYHLGMSQIFEAKLKQAHTRFLQIQKELSLVSRLRSFLLLGKLLEESGMLGRARHLYLHGKNDFLNEIEMPIWSEQYPDLNARIFSQMLRFQNQYDGILEGQKDQHRFGLESCLNGEINEDSQNDIHHALFIAEVCGESGLQPEEVISRIVQLPEDIRSLCFWEYCEWCLRSGSGNRIIDTKLAKETFSAGKDLYDAFLCDLTLGNSSQFLAKEVALKRQLARGSAIKILLLAKKIGFLDEYLQLKSYLATLLRSLDVEDRVLWQKWTVLGDELNNDKIKIEIRSRNKDQDQIESQLQNESSWNPKILVHRADESIQMNFKKSPSILHFLTALALCSESKSWTEVAEKTWKHSATESDYDRLRMLILRVNRSLEDATGIGKIFRLIGGEVQVHPLVEITYAGE